jgi:transcriptional regulator GlxA family with amidase domain
MAVALLSPLGLLRAFGCPLQDLENTRLSLRALVSGPAEAALHGALRDAASASARSAVLGRWLEDRIAGHRRLGLAAERVAAAAMSLLCGAATPIDELARRHATSRRQLERDFHHWLGVTPGTYARLVRFQRAVGAVADGVPLAHVAADHGYADQAHMTRTFREIAGITPREVRRRAAGTDGLRAALAGRAVMLAGAAASRQRLAA